MKFGLVEGDYTSFARDQSASPEDTGEGGKHLYGEHPFIMWQLDETENSFAGMFALTTNALNLNIKFPTSGRSIITFT